MLNINEINFPITFKFPIQQPITFNDAVSNGVWQVSGEESNLPLEYFIEQHNKQNPYNEPHKRHYYEMAEKKENNPGGYFFAKDGQMNLNGSFFTASIVRPGCDMLCNIEDMPVGATIKGIKNDDGEFDAITFTAKRVEIYDDVITLLSGYAGGSMPKRTQTYAAELNIKRGTLVKYSTNC